MTIRNERDAPGERSGDRQSSKQRNQGRSARGDRAAETERDLGDNVRSPGRLPGMSGSPWRRSLLWIVLLLVLSLWFLPRFLGLSDAATTIAYSTFRQQLQMGNVEEVTVQSDQIQGTFSEPVPVRFDAENRVAVAVPPSEVASAAETGGDASLSEAVNFTTYLPSFGDDELLPLLAAQEVAVTARPASSGSLWVILLNFLPFLLLIGLGFWWFSRMRGQMQGVFSVGKSQAQIFDPEEADITFDEVAGVQGAKTELREIIEFLKAPDHFQRLGGEMPKGVLLVGPPGTGKTLLARAVAGEAGVPFFSITGSNFMEMFVGVGASRVRDLFEKAKKAAPAIIFIDELDSIGRRRGAGLGGGHDEREQTLNQLLSALDGFEPNTNLVVMAATNRPDILDPALLRPGRFDRQITVDLPTLANRLEILKIHARNKPLAEEVDLRTIAQGTPGLSGADLRNLLNEAALLAARKNKTAIENEDIEDARDKILMGLERESLILTERERRLVAYHEAGHAITAAILPNADPIHKVTIVPRGRAMGVTQQMPDQEMYIYPKEYLLERIAVMMGGRAAEELVFHTATSGAENDLKEATQLVRKMVLDWGMSDRLGHIALGGRREQVFLGEELGHPREYSEKTAYEVDEEIKALLESAYTKAAETLQTNRDKLDALADALLAQEEVLGDQVLDIVGVSKQEAVSEAHRNGEVPAAVA
ncbi:MAG: ATP-dependent zinc metalloprotease FtsH [Caldilineaceae bacterium]|nr:ATP-dependent zinc metalloprotease FtsH [Caldilineaceae bacterium]